MMASRDRQIRRQEPQRAQVVLENNPKNRKPIDPPPIVSLEYDHDGQIDNEWQVNASSSMIDTSVRANSPCPYFGSERASTAESVCSGDTSHDEDFERSFSMGRLRALWLGCFETGQSIVELQGLLLDKLSLCQEVYEFQSMVAFEKLRNEIDQLEDRLLFEQHELQCIEDRLLVELRNLRPRVRGPHPSRTTLADSSMFEMPEIHLESEEIEKDTPSFDECVDDLPELSLTLDLTRNPFEFEPATTRCARRANATSAFSCSAWECSV